MPYVVPFTTSRWTEMVREVVIVELRTTDGVTGWGECTAPKVPGYCYETYKTNWVILEDFIVPALLSAEINSISDYEGLVSHITWHNMAKAGPQLALWDIFGKRENRSLQEMIGGSGEQVKVGVSVGIQDTPTKLLEVVEGYLADGYARIKLKVRPGRDLSEIDVVRQHHPKVMLQVDGNSVYRLDDLEHLKEFDQYDLLLIEQPFAQDDIIDHAKLCPRLRTPVCLDESITSLKHAQWAIELGAAKIINIKPPRVSGISEAIRIHDYCRQNDIPVWMGGMIEAGIGRAANAAVASLPGFSLPGDISASSRYYREDLVEEPLTINADSTMTVPTGPGLGIAINSKVLDRVTVHRETFRAH